MTTAIVTVDSISDLETLKEVCIHTFMPAAGEFVVFGEGPTKARLMLVGEAPGAEEAKTGLPFVGNAGRLLDKYLEETKIPREDVYVTNVLKTRPPDNRTPRKTEIKEALPFLIRQIELIRPEVLVCLGSIAVQTVLDPKARITQIRGQWTEKEGIKIMPTYHPSAIFHDEGKKVLLKQDLILVSTMLRDLLGS